MKRPTRVTMRLKKIERVKEAPRILYRLLATRPARVNISHRRMPTFAAHLAFLRRKPYKAWYLVWVSPRGYIGAVYLSKNDEIGIFLFKEYQGKGFGQEAVRLLMAKHRGVKRFLANINPKNIRSILFFKELGFRPIQNTYEATREKKGKS